jgi:hypothetical protein
VSIGGEEEGVEERTSNDLFFPSSPTNPTLYSRSVPSACLIFRVIRGGIADIVEGRGGSLEGVQGR